MSDREATASAEEAGLFRSWLNDAVARRLFLPAVCALVGFGLFTAYDLIALDLPLGREEPARFDAYHLGRTLFAVVVVAWLVLSIARASASDALIRTASLGTTALAISAALLAGAGGATFLFLLDPDVFHEQAQEDRFLEWLSAGLLMLAGIMAAAGVLLHVRDFRGRTLRNLWMTALAGLLALMAMEEISWGQRLFGFATPDALAEVNWQGEFNLHNIQTDLFETIFYSGSTFLLLILPFVRDLVPGYVASTGVIALLPSRSVAAISAPLLPFHYGNWNLLEIQMTTFAGIGILVILGRFARARGAGAEAALFLVSAVAVTLGQLIFLLYGDRMIDLPDATEYMELFIACGFLAYAWDLARRA